MKIARILITTAFLAFLAGFWVACSIGFDPLNDENTFSCVSNADCIGPSFVCANGRCGPPGENCRDDDEDGYGVGDTADCDQCKSANKCEVDCNDSDAAINPGGGEVCDGVDNDCDGEIDEVVSCTTSNDCPVEGQYLAFCQTAGGVSCVGSDGPCTCVYQVPIQGPSCPGPFTVGCVNGAREDRDPGCF